MVTGGEPGVVVQHHLGEDPVEDDLRGHGGDRRIGAGREPAASSQSGPGHGVVVQQADDLPVGRGAVRGSRPRRIPGCAPSGPPWPPTAGRCRTPPRPADPLSTTTTSAAWGRAEARHSANQRPGPVGDDDDRGGRPPPQRVRHDVAVGEVEQPSPVRSTDRGLLEQPEPKAVGDQEIDQGARDRHRRRRSAPATIRT